MNFTTASAILRGQWLLNKQWASAHLPIVAGLMKGDVVDFGNLKKEDHVTQLVHAASAGNVNVYNVRPYKSITNIEFGSIAMVMMSGPLLKNGDECSYGMVDQVQLINTLAAANNIAGIILNIDSPGGQADGTAMLASAIKDAGTKKPVIAIIDDGMAASAAMWIASAANEIYVTQTTDQVGSIGVYTTIADWKNYYESQGLTTKDIYAPQSTEKNKAYNDALAGDDTSIKENLSVLADQFINTVAANRATKIKGDSWKTGKMFFANDAKKIGLIDGVKTLSQVVGRINNLISKKQQSTNSTMAFEKTLVAANADAFAVTDEGFLLTEEQLNNLEASFTAAETNNISVSVGNSIIEMLNSTISSLTTEKEKSVNTIATQAVRIEQLEAENAALGKQSSGAKGTKLGAAQDGNEDAEIVPSYLDENNPINQFADKRVKVKK